MFRRAKQQHPGLMLIVDLISIPALGNFGTQRNSHSMAGNHPSVWQVAQHLKDFTGYWEIDEFLASQVFESQRELGFSKSTESSIFN